MSGPIPIPEPYVCNDASYLCTPWISGDEVRDCVDMPKCADPVDDDVFEDAACIASEILYNLSGRQFPGCCQQTVRPTRCDCHSSNCCGQQFKSEKCPPGCGEACSIKLAGYPIQNIDQVIINGTVLDPCEYRLDQERYLVKVCSGREATEEELCMWMEDLAAGECGPPPPGPDDACGGQGTGGCGCYPCGCWPGCSRITVQNNCNAGSECGCGDSVFEVTYTYGCPPPKAGKLAAKLLARQFVYICGNADSGVCTLPDSVTMVERRNVTYEKESFTDKIAEGGTGIYLVDSFLHAFNPHGLMRRPAVWTPDTTDKGSYGYRISSRGRGYPDHC